MTNWSVHIKPADILGMATKTSRKIIGRMIKIRREEKKITQSELAGLLHIDRQYVWRIENGVINLTMDYLDKIIDVLGCSPKDFFAI